LRDALASETADANAINAAAQTLGEAAMKLGEAMYKAQQEEQAGDSGPSADDMSAEASSNGSGGEETVVDADFEEVDDTADPEDRKDGTA
jgi:molecular chaperone DnaK